MTAKTLKKAADAVTEREAELADAAAQHRDKPAIKVTSKLSELGDQPQMRSISGGLIALGLVTRKQRLARAGVRMLLAHELATAIKNFIKNRVDRTRPRSASDKRQAKARPGKRTEKEHTSFPSGHTAGAVSVAQAFAREFPEYRHEARAAAGFVGIAQIPRCAHYPTDVGVGAIIGVAAEAMVARVWSAFERPVTPSEPLLLPPPA